jgi:hypothetical protein
VTSFTPTHEAAASAPLRKVNTTGAMDAAPRIQRRRLTSNAGTEALLSIAPSVFSRSFKFRASLCMARRDNTGGPNGRRKGKQRSCLKVILLIKRNKRNVIRRLTRSVTKCVKNFDKETVVSDVRRQLFDVIATPLSLKLLSTFCGEARAPVSSREVVSHVEPKPRAERGSHRRGDPAAGPRLRCLQRDCFAASQ